MVISKRKRRGKEEKKGKEEGRGRKNNGQKRKEEDGAIKI